MLWVFRCGCGSSSRSQGFFSRSQDFEARSALSWNRGNIFGLVVLVGRRVLGRGRRCLYGRIFGVVVLVGRRVSDEVGVI